MQNFKELSFEEMVEVDGGGFWAAVAVGLAIAGAVVYVVNNYPDMVQGYKDATAGLPPTRPECCC